MEQHYGFDYKTGTTNKSKALKRKILRISLRHLLTDMTKDQLKSNPFREHSSAASKPFFDLSITLETISVLQFVIIQEMFLKSLSEI